MSIDQIVAQAARQGYAARLARAVPRVERPGRLRARPATAAPTPTRSRGAAETTPLPMENRPARRLRAAVRRQRQHDAGGAPGADPAGPQHPRLRLRRSRLACEAARHRRPRQAESVSRRDPRHRAAHPEGRGAESTELPLFERPVGIPATFDEHARLMFDLQVLAFQTDITRVITFMMSREKQPAAVPGDRRRRRPPRPVAPPERPGEDREAHQDQHVPRRAVRLLPRQAEGDAGRRRLAARQLADPLRRAASATATRTCTPTCRSWSPAAGRARSRAAVTYGCRRTRR